MKRYLLLLLILIIASAGCYIKHPVSVNNYKTTNNDDIVVQVKQINNQISINNEIQHLYIKDLKTELIDTGIKITFTTTIPSSSVVTIIKDEKKWFDVNYPDVVTEHVCSINRVEGGSRTAIIEVYSDDKYDKSTISFVTGYKVISDSVQQVGYDSTQYVNPGKYDGNPSPCANGCR